MDTGEKIISFPHDMAAENRSKSVGQRSPAGTINWEDFHIQRHAEKSRQLTDRQKKDANNFSVLALATALKTFTDPLDCLPGLETCVSSSFECMKQACILSAKFGNPSCPIHSQTPQASDSIHFQEHTRNPSHTQAVSRGQNAKWKYVGHSFH